MNQIATLQTAAAPLCTGLVYNHYVEVSTTQELRTESGTSETTK